MDKIEVLRKSDLCQELDDEQVKIVAQMCACEVYEPGTIICKQNTKLDQLYVIEEGLVGLILELGPLSERQVQAASDFETFGWSAMIEPYISSGTVKALEKTKVLTFKREELRNLCVTHPEIGCMISYAIARIVAARLHSAYVQLLGVTYQD